MSIKAIDFSRHREYESQLLAKAMPPNSLGRLGFLALKLALIKEGPLDSLSLLLFAADHGVIEEGVTHSLSKSPTNNVAILLRAVVHVVSLPP